MAGAWGQGPDRAGTTEVIWSSPIKGEGLVAGFTRGRWVLLNPDKGGTGGTTGAEPRRG